MALRRKLTDRLAIAAGQLAAPWFYWGAKAVNSTKLIQECLRLDHKYGRAIEYVARASQNHSIAVSQMLKAAEISAALGAGGTVKKYLTDAESQLLQDIVCVIVHLEKLDGYFVEVGVGDGRQISNTYMLEKRLGWRGLLVEPNRSFHDRIREQRSAVLAPCAATKDGGKPVLFDEALDDGVYSRLSTDSEGVGSSRVESYPVESRTLDDILKEHKAPEFIEFLSLDTEGNELDVLAGLSLDRYRFGFLAIEHNYRPAVQRELDRLLNPFGYQRILSRVSEFDAWYVRSDHPLAHASSAS